MSNRNSSVKDGQQLKAFEKQIGQKESEIAELKRRLKQAESKIAEQEKQLGNELRDSELRYKHLLSSAMDGIFLIDNSNPKKPGIIIDVNQESCRYLGYSPKELIGKTVHEINAPQSNKMVKDRFKLLSEKKNLTFESIHIHKDGKEIPVEVKAQLMEVGDKTLILSMVRDISDRKEAEKQMSEREEFYYKLFNLSPSGILLVGGL
jgi:PAS domain S-box-containing protein